MARLSLKSTQVLQRLRSYKPPEFATWNRLPLSRRAAVLILLFADRRGDLRVLITMRSTRMANYSGHAAFPGGKADTLEETPFQIARREASEEIGLPEDDEKLPRPFRIEHLCQMPYNLAKTELAVRPCIAFLHADDGSGRTESMVGEALVPRPEASEVAAVFSAPFHNFLKCEDEVPEGGVATPGHTSDWYQGSWTQWHDGRWRMHNFYVPITNQRVTKPKTEKNTDQKATVEQLTKEEEEGLTRYRVWGMTARILVDAARLAYDEKPEFDFNEHMGDEKMIENLFAMGRLTEVKKAGSEITKEDPSSASKL